VHEKIAYIGCHVRACLRRIIDGLPKTGGSIAGDAVHERAGDACDKCVRNAIHGNAVHERAGDAIHERARSAGDKRALNKECRKFSPPAAFLFRCGDCFVSLNKRAAGLIVSGFFQTGS
jgi:hypothetical protein